MKTVFVVLIYPPHGVPRVVEIPAPPKEMENLMVMFKTRDKADAALSKFLTANPEYRRWRDGCIHPEAAPEPKE